ncbi:hypothetical protein [Streptomyces hokutonensis]|uniref:hypothetical protein n=1 Tax=Streptomyces hokutonensis TaxID=1306990 RepID=UPI0033E092D2
MRDMPEEEAPGDVVVLYRLRSEADAVLLNEVCHLVALRGGRLHLLTGRTGEGGTPPFSPGSLYRLVPDIIERDVYVCISDFRREVWGKRRSQLRAGAIHVDVDGARLRRDRPAGSAELRQPMGGPDRG